MEVYFFRPGCKMGEPVDNRKSSLKKRIEVPKSSLTKLDRYERIKKGSFYAVLDKKFCEPEQFCQFMDNIDQKMAKGRIVKNLEDSRSTYISCLDFNGLGLIVKRYNYRGVVHSFRHTIKRSRARRNWSYIHRLEKLNIPGPRALAYVEIYWGPFIKKSYFISEHISAQNLHDFLRSPNTSNQQLSDAVGKVAHLIRRMGECKIFHGDLKLENILLAEDRAIIVDLDSMRFHRWSFVYKFWRARDLKQLKNYIQRYPRFESAICRAYSYWSQT